MPQAMFVNQQKAVPVEAGVTVLEAARRAGITVESPCNGSGSCGKCKVGVKPVHGKETAHGVETVMACQRTVDSDIEIFVRDYDDDNKSLQILTGGSNFLYEHHPFITKKPIHTNGTADMVEKTGAVEKTGVYGGVELLGVEEGDTSGETYGLAVDIGTTTLVTALVNLQTGAVLALESSLNPQAVYAQDVLGRIHFASTEQGLATLHEAFTGALNGMIAALTRKTGVKREHIYEAVYSGNTAMLHIACRVDPAPLGRFPYTPNISGGSHIPAAALNISPFGRIWLPPVISAWVGADITSGILSSRLSEKKGVVIFIDIGTNGEMVLANGGALAASSTAAGPAFEGMNICCGMRASRGAIESFSIDGDRCTYEVIGEDAPFNAAPTITGICGSGLLDIAAELVRTGIVGKSGRFAPPAGLGVSGRLAQSMRPHEGKPAFFVTDTVYVAQKDIRQIQLAKGAIRCGIEMLLARFGLTAASVDAVEIAGSFGYHLREQSLLNIGLLPPEFAGKTAFIGNTSMSGGIAFLLNTHFRTRMTALVRKIDTVELACDKDFERTFIKYLSF
jgi:uncharacterized 2Fe-2S/4Fe-4S cluster protein (DUF4445 family)